jgi:membrane fusion protein, multidrug efflux system
VLPAHHPADAADQKVNAENPPAASSAAPPPPAAAGWAQRRPRLFAIALVLLFLGAAAYFLVPDLYREETDDAYVEAHVLSIIPKVPAYVQALHVDDNSKVQAGELLVELDPRDYAVQLDLAKANVAAAQGRLQEAGDQVAVADAGIRQAHAELQVTQANAVLGQADLKRVKAVSDVRAVSAERIDQAQAAADSTQASATAAQVKVAAAEAQAQLARSQLVTAKAALAQAQAAQAQAELNLSYTRIYAAENGSVASKNVEAGNYVQPGQTLLSVVPETIYVIANYKETQLTRIRPGQAVRIHVDSFPSLRLKGHVDSIQRGTGSRFALLPPENATGNFVKVVQRVPVKIVFDQPEEALRWIAPGMSVETEVFVSKRLAWLAGSD